MPIFELNKPAPQFCLLDENGKKHCLKDYKGKFVLLFFYPKDMTPGCTLEACRFRDTYDELEKRNLVVIGVNTNDATSHKLFKEKHKLQFPLLVDDTHEVVKAYGVFKEKNLFGKKVFGVVRQSFLVDPQGVLVKHYIKVNTLIHVDEVLRDIN